MLHCSAFLPLSKPSRLFNIIGRDNDELKKPIYSQLLANTSPLSLLCGHPPWLVVFCMCTCDYAHDREEEERKRVTETQWI